MPDELKKALGAPELEFLLSSAVTKIDLFPDRKFITLGNRQFQTDNFHASMRIEMREIAAYR
jgi:hypothetical protein